MLAVGTLLVSSPSTRHASVGFLVAAPTLAAALTAAVGLRRNRRWMSAVMVEAYVLVALWELVPWQRRPFWSGFIVALVLGVSLVAWLRLVIAPARTPNVKKRARS